MMCERIRTHTPKAICLTNIFKVGGINKINKGNRCLTLRIPLSEDDKVPIKTSALLDGSSDMPKLGRCEDIG